MRFYIIKGIGMGQGEIFYGMTEKVGRFFLQVTGLDIHYFVKYSPRMKSGHVLLRRYRRIVQFGGQQEAPVGKCIFDLVAIMRALPGSQDGLHIGGNMTFPIRSRLSFTCCCLYWSCFG